MSLALFACGGSCKNHADTNGDGLCEECGKAAEPSGETAHDLTLIKDGEALFDIVLGEDASVDVRFTITSLKETLKSAGINVDVLDNDSTQEKECEVLIGNVTTRGKEYQLDRYSYGMDGYAIKIIGEKLLIVGGSDESLESAIERFIDNILEADDIDDTSTVIMTTDMQKEIIQDDYEIKSIKIGGADVKDYTIAVDSTDKYLLSGAIRLQTEIYKRSGRFLKLVALSDAGDKSIVIKSAPKDDSPEDSFRINVRGTAMFIEIEYSNELDNQLSLFISKQLSTDNEEISLSGEVMTADVSFVTYERFGAKGDGKTDDFAAIKAAHDHANLSGQTVKAKNGATYYIHDTRVRGTATPIQIKTNVQWGTAKFIIDDTDLYSWDGTGMYAKNIFIIPPETESYEIAEVLIKQLNATMKIGRDTTKLDLGLGEAAMLVVYNSNHRVYRRYGVNADDGAQQQELVLVDEHGNIDPSTPFLLDYETVTSITVYSVDDTPLTISGGIITTKASQVSDIKDGKAVGKYFKRGIQIERSNVTISGMEHYVTGQYAMSQKEEGLRNPSYSGFVYANSCNNVLVIDCVFTAKQGNGTYDIGGGMVNNYVFKNCTQSNFFLEDGITPSTSGQKYWGVMGSNLCKNVTFDTCKLTRFDAHKGVYNGKIINSEVSIINLTGGGNMLVENTKIHRNVAVSLREDYGSTWNGTITIKDCTLVVLDPTAKLQVCASTWTNHDFGYKCYFPNIIVDNLSIEGSVSNEIALTIGSGADGSQAFITTEPNIHIGGAFLYTTGYVNINPYVPPQFIKVINNNSGLTFYYNNTPFFDNTEVVGFEHRD